MSNKKLIIFASGTKTAGGSGFEKLVEANLKGDLKADIVAVVSNHKNGGVRKIAEKYNIDFEYFSKPYTAEKYKKIVKKYNAEFVALSG